ncbi:MAG: hypothetical protein H6985_14830 [Pseudomonadales bacterium]|nr:hypothetical protein [Halioglobus sp.]MCP5130845.1 hypothetical protein [Pseudomonadales bacterium]
MPYALPDSAGGKSISLAGRGLATAPAGGTLSSPGHWAMLSFPGLHRVARFFSRRETRNEP